MPSFALRVSIHFLVQNTSQYCIQSIEISPDKVPSLALSDLSSYCLTVQLAQLTCRRLRHRAFGQKD